MTKQNDVCYGPIAVGQFFINLINPSTPQYVKTVGILTDSVFICEMWGMNERNAEWSFGPRPNDGGWQIATINLQRMERVTELDCRHHAEQELRRRDDEWRAQFYPNREPIKITRCQALSLINHPASAAKKGHS